MHECNRLCSECGLQNVAQIAMYIYIYYILHSIILLLSLLLLCIALLYSQLVDCERPSCNFPGGVVVPAGEDECCPTCGCNFGNGTYRVGDSFPAGDGCNTWYECIEPSWFHSKLHVYHAPYMKYILT